MTKEFKTLRQVGAEVDPIFVQRWSPRSYSTDPISQGEIERLFEAARWAPSCFNEQPWQFIYATEGQRKEKIMSLLVEANREWAEPASLVAILFAKRSFAKNGSSNRHYAFDSGSAWLSLALQAQKMGLAAHAMGGFDEEASYEVLGMPKSEYEAMAAIVVGHIKTDEAERTPRKPLEEVARGL